MKKSSTKRTILFLLICIMILAFSFTGCSRQSDGTAGNDTSSGTDKSSRQNTDTSEQKKDPDELKFFVYEHINWPITNDTPVLKEIENRINIKINFIPVPGEGFNDKLNITMASGDLPDLMCLDIDEIKNYGIRGAFIPLNQLVEKDAPSIKELLTPDVIMKLVAEDGNYYGIPILGGTQARNGWLIRKDWLDKLNLKEPDTIDDWEMVLKAFKDNTGILVGDKQNDLIPWVVRQGSYFIIEHSIPAFGLHPENWTIIGDELVSNYTHEKYKECLLWLRRIYEQGLLDQEYIMLSAQMWEERMSSGIAGATTDYISRTDRFNSAAREQNPDFNLVALVPLAGPEGHRGTLAYDSVDSMFTTGITKDCKNKDAAIRYLDFLFSDEGAELTTYGVEGITHIVKDGQKVWVDEILNDKGNVALLAKHGIMQWCITRRFLPAEENFSSEPNYIEGAKRAEPYYIDPFPSLNFSVQDSEKIRDIWSAVEPIIIQFRDQYITGAIPEEDWDKFQTQLKNAGIDEYIRIHQEAYAKYIEMKKTMK